MRSEFTLGVEASSLIILKGSASSAAVLLICMHTTLLLLAHRPQNSTPLTIVFLELSGLGNFLAATLFSISKGGDGSMSKIDFRWTFDAFQVNIRFKAI